MHSKGAYKVSGTNEAGFAQTRLELELRRVHEGLALNERRARTPTSREMQDKTLTAFVTLIEEPAHNGRRNNIIAYGVGTPYGLLLSLMPQPFPLENCGRTQVVLPVDPLSQQTTRDVLHLSAGGSVV